MTSTTPKPGLLYVTMQPHSSLPAPVFHDWYNNEHGPTRLRLPFVLNGFRYRATDLSPDADVRGLPAWLAIYDITDMEELTKETYTSLRTDRVKSQREKDVMKQISVDRKLFDLSRGKKWEAEGYKRMEELEDGEKRGNVLVAVRFKVNPGKGPELEKWYEEEHIPLLAKVPGWRRTRRFITSSISSPEEDGIEYLALHEYAPQNGLGGPQWQASISTDWAREILRSVIKEKERRTYELYYTFGPAPRDLDSLTSTTVSEFVSRDARTRVLPAPSSGLQLPAIESYVTTSDGVALPYRLEGSSDPHAPLIILSNSVMVTYSIWDDFVRSFYSRQENRQYRILRYNTRGRTADVGDQDITMDLLSSDIITFLDALRVRKVTCVIGVSLGGATVLRTAFKYPERVQSFVSCDTNAVAPANNPKLWAERIEVAQIEGARSSSGLLLVGDRLADMTVKRWFVELNHSTPLFDRMKDMVRNNSLDGFSRQVRALFQYDFTDQMPGAKVKGLFVVGKQDGVLPGTMKGMVSLYGSDGGRKAGLRVVDQAGHLPMVEKPEDVAAIVSEFLKE